MIAQFDSKNFLVLRYDGVYVCNVIWGWEEHDDGNKAYTFVAPYPRKEIGVSYEMDEVEGVCAVPGLEVVVLEVADGSLFRLPFSYDALPLNYGDWLEDGEQL